VDLSRPNEMEDDLKKIKMKMTSKKIKNGRQPQKKMEDDLKNNEKQPKILSILN
jgi:hypothetical protein